MTLRALVDGVGEFLLIAVFVLIVLMITAGAVALMRLT